MFEAVQVAGRIIDLQRGSTMAEMFAPQLQERVSELGQFKMQLAIVLFYRRRAPPLYLRVVESFATVPGVGYPHLSAGWTQGAAFITQLAGSVLAIGVQLAAPGIIALLLTDLLFGIVNRVAPQINVSSSASVKMVVGIVVVLLALPLSENATFITSAKRCARSWRRFVCSRRTRKKEASAQDVGRQGGKKLKSGAPGECRRGRRPMILRFRRVFLRFKVRRDRHHRVVVGLLAVRPGGDHLVVVVLLHLEPHHRVLFTLCFW